MKKHNGMRPHDIVILLKIATKGEQDWFMKDLSKELQISASEISESINRSSISGLLLSDKKQVNVEGLLNFLEHGLAYVFPQQPGVLVQGLPTSHSALPLSQLIKRQERDPYVWPTEKGNVMGQAIEPLHPKLPEACIDDFNFYQVMALCENMRVGEGKEKKIAIGELREKMEDK